MGDSRRLPENLAPGCRPRFYIARQIIPWEEGDPHYEAAKVNVDTWSHKIEDLYPVIEKMRANWETVTHIVEVLPMQTPLDEPTRLWVIHDLPQARTSPANDEPGDYPDFGTW